VSTVLAWKPIIVHQDLKDPKISGRDVGRDGLSRSLGKFQKHRDDRGKSPGKRETNESQVGLAFPTSALYSTGTKGGGEEEKETAPAQTDRKREK